MIRLEVRRAWIPLGTRVGKNKHWLIFFFSPPSRRSWKAPKGLQTESGLHSKPGQSVLPNHLSNPSSPKGKIWSVNPGNWRILWKGKNVRKSRPAFIGTLLACFLFIFSKSKQSSNGKFSWIKAVKGGSKPVMCVEVGVHHICSSFLQKNQSWRHLQLQWCSSEGW